MSVLDELESRERQRSRIIALAAIVAVLAAVVAYVLWSRGGDDEEVAGIPAEAIELGGGRSGLRPKVLESFERSKAVSADGGEVGKEIDAAYSYPQRRGVQAVEIIYTSPFIDQQLRTWLKQFGGTEDQIQNATVEILYSWSYRDGAKVEIRGWPEELQPLELERHKATILKLCELVIPRTQEEFLSEYGVRVQRAKKGMVVWAERANANAALETFTKYYSPNWRLAYIEGEGAFASFETITEYQVFDDQTVVKKIRAYVDTPNKILHYDIEPLYGEFEGVWIAGQIAQTYYDESGATEGMPLALVLKEIRLQQRRKREVPGPAADVK